MSLKSLISTGTKVWLDGVEPDQIKTNRALGITGADVNPLATVLLSSLHASVCFIGCNGVDAASGVTNINLPEAEIKRAMLLAAGLLVLSRRMRR